MNRREFLERSLAGTTLLAAGTVVPGFLAATARAAEPGKDNVLVVVELTGGNDGLNTVVPYADDLYHKNRPTLRLTKREVLSVGHDLGLHPALRTLHAGLHETGQLAIVQNVGYPNPDRSHFESMDIWHLADPKRQQGNGWLGRTIPTLQDAAGHLPALHLGEPKAPLPLALQGAAGGVVSLSNGQPFQLELAGTKAQQKERRSLLDGITNPETERTGLAGFVRRRQLHAYASIDKLQAALNEEMKPGEPAPVGGSTLNRKLDMVSRIIRKNLGTRLFYVAIDGFDTHSRQGEMHSDLLREVSDAISSFFTNLTSEHAPRVCVLTFSEFGRRVRENGSKGTDHGAGSNLFVAGPAVQGGVLGGRPKLDDLDAGDLKHTIDFRQVYATLLERWLKVDSQTVLGDKFAPLPLFKA
jgi:uncharacterized protein (DUF1501 family)